MAHTAPAIEIDFVSDIACPWCAVGLGSLEQAIANIKITHPDLKLALRFQPFQLNPHMPPEGQEIGEHLSQKYGSTLEQQAANYEAIRARGAAVGFEFRETGRGRTWNTFDCHRLLFWVLETAPEQQLALKKALLKANFTQGVNPAEHALLISICAELKLNVAQAQHILASDAYTQEVRSQQQFYASHQINSVPAVIINQQYLVSGGQPTETFELTLRQIISDQAST
jgi:predicted DsbA family dithiol-disulfide isomerase